MNEDTRPLYRSKENEVLNDMSFLISIFRRSEELGKFLNNCCKSRSKAHESSCGAGTPAKVLLKNPVC